METMDELPVVNGHNRILSQSKKIKVKYTMKNEYEFI